MNTKDNQEAEREAFEELKFIDEKLRQSKKLDMSKVYGNWFLKHEKAIRATLTTPQVNDELASGEREALCAKYCARLTDESMKSDMYQGVDAKDLIDALYEREKEEIRNNLTTPIPSNVLVEALEELAEQTPWGGEAWACQNWIMGIAQKALATYSASTDSVSISRIEYEALVADKDRLAFLHTANTDAEGYEYGVAKVRFAKGQLSTFEWALSDSSDIDTARKSS